MPLSIVSVFNAAVQCPVLFVVWVRHHERWHDLDAFFYWCRAENSILPTVQMNVQLSTKKWKQVFVYTTYKLLLHFLTIKVMVYSGICILEGGSYSFCLILCCSQINLNIISHNCVTNTVFQRMITFPTYRQATTWLATAENTDNSLTYSLKTR